MKALVVFGCLLVSTFGYSYNDLYMCGCKPSVPVCGTDLKTYPSKCALECYPNDGSIQVLAQGTCEDYIKSLPIPVSVPSVQPYVPSPQPYVPSPQPYVPSPQPYVPSPQPSGPSVLPYVPSPQPYAPIVYPQPYVPTAPGGLRQVTGRRCTSGHCTL